MPAEGRLWPSDNDGNDYDYLLCHPPHIRIVGQTWRHIDRHLDFVLHGTAQDMICDMICDISNSVRFDQIGCLLFLCANILCTLYSEYRSIFTAVSQTGLLYLDRSPVERGLPVMPDSWRLCSLFCCFVGQRSSWQYCVLGAKVFPV